METHIDFYEEYIQAIGLMHKSLTMSTNRPYLATKNLTKAMKLLRDVANCPIEKLSNDARKNLKIAINRMDSLLEIIETKEQKSMEKEQRLQTLNYTQMNKVIDLRKKAELAQANEEFDKAIAIHEKIVALLLPYAFNHANDLARTKLSNIIADSRNAIKNLKVIKKEFSKETNINK